MPTKEALAPPHNATTMPPQAVQRQPTINYFYVDSSFSSSFFYAGGILNGPCRNDTINHAVLVVGEWAGRQRWRSCTPPDHQSS